MRTAGGNKQRWNRSRPPPWNREDQASSIQPYSDKAKEQGQDKGKDASAQEAQAMDQERAFLRKVLAQGCGAKEVAYQERLAYIDR